jgi:hypothetical protein
MNSNLTFKDKFRSWQADRAAIQNYFQTPDTTQTIWPGDWYLGKNIGLERWEALKALPGAGGAAAAILAGRAGNSAASQRAPVAAYQPVDMTPIYIIGGLVLAAVLLRK